MEALFRKHNRLLKVTSTKIVRKQMETINWEAPLIAVRGPRGVGKTTLMLQYIKLHYSAAAREVLYCTLDSVFFSSHNLLELAEEFYINGGKHLFFGRGA